MKKIKNQKLFTIVVALSCLFIGIMVFFIGDISSKISDFILLHKVSSAFIILNNALVLYLYLRKKIIGKYCLIFTIIANITFLLNICLF